MNSKQACQSCEADGAFLRGLRPAYEQLRPCLRLVDLFAGCGGLSLGVAEAARRAHLGIDVRLAVDASRGPVAAYKANFPNANVREAKVEEYFDGQIAAELTSTERALASELGSVDILVGGPPCQGHSDLNNHSRRQDPRNALYARMARAAEVLRPSIVLIENVPTVRHDTEGVVDITVQGLRSAGYEVADAVLDLSTLGAPQRRRRHVILALRGSDLKPGDVLTNLSSQCVVHTRTVRWAIHDLIDVKGGLLDTPSVPSARNAKRIGYLFKERVYDLPNSLRPKCHQSDHSYRSMYGRLKWNEPAQTLTTGFGSMGQGRYVHPARRRTITPHEGARLQMLPDFMDFSSIESRTTIAELIGNAVPPVLAIAVLQSVIPALISRQYSDEAARLVKRIVSDAMVPMPPSDEAHRRMRATARRDTQAELRIRAALDKLALTYEVDRPPLATRGSRADVLFRAAKVAVFVDGCFWHCCPVHGTQPKHNGNWWASKLEANRRRDAAVSETLHTAGWTVLRFWEHEEPTAVAAAIARQVADTASHHR